MKLTKKERKIFENNFDIDEEIDIYRQDEEYKKVFTIRQSVEDFEDWVNWLNDISKELIK